MRASSSGRSKAGGRSWRSSLGIGGGSDCEGVYGSADEATRLREITRLFEVHDRGVFWDLCQGRLEDGLDEDDCFGSAAVGTGGAFECNFGCRDTEGHEYGVTCRGVECDCEYDGTVYCSCTDDEDGSCVESCCPPPWVFDTGDGSGGESGTTVAVSGAGGSGG